MNSTDIIGWSSAAILLLTISRQVYTQWRTRSTQGLSKWLFIGQIATSLGFVVYSFLLENWVFVTTNAFIAAAAVVGQWLYLRNKRVEADRRSKAQPRRDGRAEAAHSAPRAAQQPGESRGKPGGAARHPARRKPRAAKDGAAPREPTLQGTPPASPRQGGVISGEDQIRPVPPPGALKRPRTRRARTIPPA